MTAVLVLHDIGDEAGGGPWRDAFGRSGWDGPVLAPDLPGHASEPPPIGGNYDLADAAFLGARVLTERGLDGPPVIVGVGANGWSAELLALGGRAAGLVLVDGLNGPWLDPVETTEVGVNWLRALLADPVAVAPAPTPTPTGGLDPRLRHRIRPHGDRATAERAAAAVRVPVLVVETPASSLGPAERDDLVARFPDASTVELPAATPAAVATAVHAWWPTA